MRGEASRMQVRAWGGAGFAQQPGIFLRGGHHLIQMKARG